MSTLQTQPTRLFLKNILFPTDFSSPSEMALPYVKALASHYGSTVFVAHVYPTEPLYELPISIPAALQQNRESAEARMKEFIEKHDLTNVPHEVILKAGDVWMSLSDIVGKKNIDLVVVGTHGRKTLMTLVLGSVAEEVIRRSVCPVLTVPSHVQPKEGAAAGEFRHILYATDFSAVSAQALVYALSLAQESAASLTLLHAVEEPVIDTTLFRPEPESSAGEEALEQECAIARERLHEMLPTDLKLNCRPELLVQAGTPGDTILKTAEARHADLIVLGARHTRAPHLVAHAPWRTVHRVICDAHCPVLTVSG